LANDTGWPPDDLGIPSNAPRRQADGTGCLPNDAGILQNDLGRLANDRGILPDDLPDLLKIQLFTTALAIFSHFQPLTGYLAGVGVGAGVPPGF
jgi:hypothetical protein